MALILMLYFDLATELRLRDLWARLAGEGISDAMAHSGLRPHITLAGIQDADPALLRDVLAKLARTTPPLTVELAAVGTFPTDEGVVYIAPAVTPALLTVHERLHRELQRLGIRSAAYHRPGRWVPHCTAAIRLPAHRMAAAVSACCQSEVFGPAPIVELGLGEHPSMRELAVFALQGANDD